MGISDWSGTSVKLGGGVGGFSKQALLRPIVSRVGGKNMAIGRGLQLMVCCPVSNARRAGCWRRQAGLQRPLPGSSPFSSKQLGQ